MSQAIVPVGTVAGGHAPAAAREASFRHLATIGLSLMGFTGLFIGLSHLLNGHGVFAFILAFCIQGLAVSAIHAYKQARSTGGSLNVLRGGRHLALYVILTAVIVTMSYSFWYRLQRANAAADERFAEQKQSMLGKLTALEARYRAIGDGFAALSVAAAARAQEEKASGNTCRIASPKGPGPIQQFRSRDAQDFRDYAAQVRSNVTGISEHAERLRAQALGTAGEIKATQAALNDMAGQINAGLIGNPMLSGIVQFIDARLLAADNINYFGRTVKCEDEHRTAQLIALKSAAREIIKEPILPQVRLFNPESTYENALLAANRIGALVEWLNPLSSAKLSDLDPTIREARLSNGVKVYIAADYWPLLFAAVIEVILFLVVPPPRRDDAKRDFIQAVMQGEERLLRGRTLRKLLWMMASTPSGQAEIEVPSPAKPLDLPVKFLRLRPYLQSFKNRFYLVIPHDPGAAMAHDYANALYLKGHAKPLVEGGLTVGSLPSPVWTSHLLRLLASRTAASGTNGSPALLHQGSSDPLHDVPVRVLEVSREFFAWAMARIVELDDDELRPEPAQARKRASA